VKAALLGTTDYHATMRELARDALLRKYILQMTENALELPPVDKRFTQHTDTFIQSILRNNSFINCNPRSLYLFLAWLLSGSDNQYRTYPFADNIKLQLMVAILQLRIALGDNTVDDMLNSVMIQTENEPMQTPYKIVEVAYSALLESDIEFAAYFAVKSTVSYAADVQKNSNSGYPYGFSNDSSSEIKTLNRFRGLIWNYVTLRLKEWAYISDDEALQIARQLLFDILDAGK
jgi:hypothetical protein